MCELRAIPGYEPALAPECAEANAPVASGADRGSPVIYTWMPSASAAISTHSPEVMHPCMSLQGYTLKDGG
jgi:hypothetical protein